MLLRLSTYSLLAQGTDKQTQNPSQHVHMAPHMFELRGYQVGMGLKSKSYWGLTVVHQVGGLSLWGLKKYMGSNGQINGAYLGLPNGLVPK